MISGSSVAVFHKYSCTKKVTLMVPSWNQIEVFVAAGDIDGDEKS